MEIKFPHGGVYVPNSVFSFDTYLKAEIGDGSCTGLLMPEYFRMPGQDDMLNKVKEISKMYVNGEVFPVELEVLQEMFDDIPISSPYDPTRDIKSKFDKDMKDISEEKGDMWPTVTNLVKTMYQETSNEYISTLFAKIPHESLKGVSTKDIQFYEELVLTTSIQTNGKYGHQFHVGLTLKDGNLPDRHTIDVLVADKSQMSDSFRACSEYSPEEMNMIIDFVYEMLPDKDSIAKLQDNSDKNMTIEIIDTMSQVANYIVIRTASTGVILLGPAQEVDDDGEPPTYH